MYENYMEKQDALWRREGPSMALNVVVLILFALYTGFILFMTTFSLCEIDGDSMLETLHDKDNVLLIKDDNPKYKDIIVLQRPDKLIIKRVIAAGGDTVRFEYTGIGKVYAQLTVKRRGESAFKPVVEDYINGGNGAMLAGKCPMERDITVPDGEFYVMGDNRNNSSDSRNIDGLNNPFFVKRGDIFGKMVYNVPKNSVAEKILRFLYPKRDEAKDGADAGGGEVYPNKGAVYGGLGAA